MNAVQEKRRFDLILFFRINNPEWTIEEVVQRANEFLWGLMQKEQKEMIYAS